MICWKADFVVECVHLDGNILQRTFQMNNVTLVGIIEEEFKKMSSQLFSNTYNKAHDKLKSKLEMEIFVEMHTRKKLWSNGTTTKLKESKEQN
jgi:hypothetical protein